MMLSEALLKMIQSEDELSLYCGRIIKQMMGWKGSDEQARDRLIQCCKEHSPYNVNIDWYLVLQDIFVRHGIDDLVSPLIYEARQNAKYELNKEKRASPMLSVRPRSRARDVGTAS